MKKTIYPAVFSLAILLITSCGGSSIESDAKKLADLQCRAQKLSEKVAAGDMGSMQESLDLTKEATQMFSELEAKYTTESEKEKLAEALLKEMGNCK